MATTDGLTSYTAADGRISGHLRLKEGLGVFTLTGAITLTDVRFDGPVVAGPSVTGALVYSDRSPVRATRVTVASASATPSGVINGPLWFETAVVGSSWTDVWFEDNVLSCASCSGALA